MKTYNVYCDESSVENSSSEFFYIGSIVFQRDQRDEFKNALKEIYARYDFKGELKWNKLSNSYLGLYKEVVDFFYDNKIAFRAVKVPKKEIDLNKYHDGDGELAFYKFYYYLLKWFFKSNTRFYIFLDKRNNRQGVRVRGLGFYLRAFMAGLENTELKHIQAYDSKENIFIQLADFFVGAVAYSNSDGSSEIKNTMVDYISIKIGKDDLKFKSPNTELKFNIFQLFDNK